MLDYLKLEKGQISLEQIPMPLQDTVKRSVKDLASRAQSKNVDFVLHIEPNIPDLLVGDPIRTIQILNILLDNATKFTNEGKVLLWVKLVNKSQTSVTLHFSVVDTGYGISEERLSTLFKRVTMATNLSYFQLPYQYGGLAIATKLVELMGGTISVESAVGKGSTFHFTVDFGLHEIQPQYDFLKNKHILLMHYNDHTRTILAGNLAQHAMQVVVAQDENDAIAKISNTTVVFDYILLDTKAPDLYGLSVTNYIKNLSTLCVFIVFNVKNGAPLLF